MNKNNGRHIIYGNLHFTHYCISG